MKTIKLICLAVLASVAFASISSCVPVVAGAAGYAYAKEGGNGE